MNKILLSLIVLIALVACDQTATDKKTMKPVYQGTLLTFLEGEAGIESYTVRMMITPTFLRMDYGSDEDGYILLDRRTGDLNNVNPFDQSNMKMKRRSIELLPAETLVQRQEKNIDDNAPMVDGKQPIQYGFFANDEQCYVVVAVDGLLEDERKAIEEFVLTLAGEQAANIDNTPEEMRSDCMMVNLIYSPNQHLQHGFPIQEWAYNGYNRALIDYKVDQVFDESLFEIPPDYREYSLTAE